MIRDVVLFLSAGSFHAIIIPLLIAHLVAYFRNPAVYFGDSARVAGRLEVALRET